MNVAAMLSRWQAMSSRVRMGIGIGVLVAVGAALFAGIIVQRPRVALFADPLRSEQLAEVEDRLAGWGVPFAPSADNVVVDAARRSDLLLRLSLAGVPHPHIAGSGETLATIGALTPQAVIDAQTRAGLAGDIELGLRGIDGIDDAQVIVAPAKPAEFADEASRSGSASVRLHLRGSAHLSQQAVAGIRRYVAAGVAGLDASRVTVVDDSGVALDTPQDDATDADGLQTSVQSAMDQAFGNGASIVRLHAERGGNGKGVPAVTRRSAAIFVDANRQLDIAKIRALVSAAIGFDPRRGDMLSIEAVDFARDATPHHNRWWPVYGALVSLLPSLVTVIGALCALRFAGPPIYNALRALVDRAATARTKEAIRGFAPAQVAGALRNEPPHAAAAIISALPTATAAAVLDMYPAHERSAIVRRMQRAHSPLVPDAREIVEHA